MTQMQNAKCKRQNYNAKLKIFGFLRAPFTSCLLPFTFYLLPFTFHLLPFTLKSASAKEITILYTGSTHAMLYPCHCPKEPDGGVSRRATLIKQMKRKYPGALVLDSGSFFAGGLLDEYTQNTQLDMQRTAINLRAMELAGYDAAVIGDDEFNFGREYLENAVAAKKMAFLSCNIESGKFLPYIIKESGGRKIGIIGVTDTAAKQKAGGLKFREPQDAVKKTAAELKAKGAEVIVLLSRLSEAEDLILIDEVKDIDILIAGYRPPKAEPFSRRGRTLILRPDWQGRRLGRASFAVKDGKLTVRKIEELRLSDKIAGDPDILSILPRCFADSGCKKDGIAGSCLDPGSLNSRCVFENANKVNLRIITTRNCLTCDTKRVTELLKKQFPGLESSYLYYPESKEAMGLIKDCAISSLPAYLLGKEVEKEEKFNSLKADLEAKGNFYMLKPRFSGISYLLNREKIKGKLDLFVSLYDKNSAELLDAAREFNPALHFLAVEERGGFSALHGNIEIEESLRAVCVEKYYPEYFFNYAACRAKNIDTSWWEDCLGNYDAGRIKACARGEEGRSLLRENTSLSRELQVMFGPAYLLDNQEIFGSEGVPTKEELRRIIRK